jgi:hypothetical protein
MQIAYQYASALKIIVIELCPSVGPCDGFRGGRRSIELGSANGERE